MNIIESYEINNKLYLNTKFLCAYFNRTDKQIGRWKQQGMPIATKPKELNKRGDWYILDDVIKWVDININKTKANNSKGANSDEIDIENEEEMFNIYTKGNVQQKRKLLLSLPQNRLDDFKKIEEIVEKEAKNKEYDSKYALIDKVKKGQQELASMFISLLKTSMAVLSKDVEMKEQDDVFHILDRHFKKEIDKLVKYINKEEENTVTFDEVIQTIVDLVSEKNIDQIKIIKTLKSIK